MYRSVRDSTLISVKATATVPVMVKSLLGFLGFINIVNRANPRNRVNFLLLALCSNPPLPPFSKGGVGGLLLSVFCSVLIFIYGCGGPEHYIRPKTDISNIKRVAVLPMENFTSDEYAGEKIRRVVITELLSRGIDVIEPGEVTRVLRESNIRSLGSIKIADIQNMGKTLGVEAVMMGSVEAFGISRGISVSYPEVTINLILFESS